MRRLFILLFALFALVACTNLDDVEQRLTSLETQLDELQKAFDASKKIRSIGESEHGYVIYFTDGTSIDVVLGQISSIEEDSQSHVITLKMIDGTVFKFIRERELPLLTSLSFLAEDNVSILLEDVPCTIIDDGSVLCRTGYFVTDKLLVPSFTYIGDSVAINGIKTESHERAFDFSKPVTLAVYRQGQHRDYTISFSAFTGLPVIWIETNDRQDITSKTEYLPATIQFSDDIIANFLFDNNEIPDLPLAEIGIRGRGNTTWQLPKKLYQIKFKEAESLFEMPVSKKWVLLANYTDKTQLRNEIAFYMGRQLSNLSWTPRSQFVEMVLNGQYNGTYQLTEKIFVDPEHVDVGSDGFLLEIDSNAHDDEVTFSIDHIKQPINVKEPAIAAGDASYNYITNYLSEADKALYGSDFTDPENGWRKWIDEESFIDWYIINEIAKNNDAIFLSSCYMHLKRGEKLKMGPLWDFDIAFGNVNYNENYMTEGFWVKYSNWYNRFFQDPSFVSKVKERYAYFYEHKADVMQHINIAAQHLRYSVEENEHIWHTLYTHTWPNYNVWGNYQNEVQFLKTWLSRRMDWLYEAINQLDTNNIQLQ
ncbi:MAG: CotH kinase family protein [Prevotella sp.]|nr:CotH kinase family protein [Prevotella sp.]